MRKTLVLFLFIIMGLPCFAYSATTQMIMMNNIMMMSAVRNSHYSPPKKHQSGYEICMKYKGGNACKAKYRVTKLHEGM